MAGAGSPRMIQEYFSFSRDLDNLFVESGRQAHVIWRLDGSFGGLRAVSKEIVNPPGGGTEGIWAEPLRLADYVHFHVWDAENGLVPVERHAKRYTRQVGSSEIFYQFGTHPYLEIRKTVWVPLQSRAVVVELALKNTSDRPRELRVFTEFQSHLSVGWPLREGGRNTASFEPSLRAVVAHDEGHPSWTAVCAATRAVEACHLGDFEAYMIGSGAPGATEGGTRRPSRGRSCLQHAIELAGDAEERLAVVISGSTLSEHEARETARNVMGRLDELREEKRGHYLRLFTDTTVLESPSYVLNKAFLWAKLGTEDFKHEDPRLGFLFFAGYPAYNFYFASDSMLILRGSLAIGDFEDAKRMLRTIVRYQATSAGRDTLPGEIWHEMSTSGDRISPNFAGFLFPGLLRAFHAWTGDREFLEEMYPRARAVLEWGYLMDANGDGLLENGPEGEMADSASEDRNVERSHFLVQTQWLDALREGAGLAELVGDRQGAERFTATLKQLQPLVNGLYWNEHERYFEETLRPDGCLDTSGKGFADLDPGAVDEGKAAATARLLLEEEAYLTDVEAFRARKEFEQTFSTHRAYMSWYVIERGRRALTLYRSHRPDPAYRALEDIAGSPFHFTTPGLWPEVWAVDEPSSLRVRGCFHQAWTGSHGFIHPLVNGLLGLEPDAANHAVTLDPHLPPHWPRLGVRHLRLGQGSFDVECEQEQGWRRLALHNASSVPLKVRLGFALPPAVRLRELAIDGQARSLDELAVETTPLDVHAYASAVAVPGAAVAVELRWEPADVRIELPGEERRRPSAAEPLLLERAPRGATVSLAIQLRNLSCDRVRRALLVEAPSGWSVPAAQRDAVELGANATSTLEFSIAVPRDVAEGYYPLRLRLSGEPALHVVRTLYLPVFRPVAVSVDAREVCKAGLPYVVDIPVRSLSPIPVSATVRVRWPEGWQAPRDQAEIQALAPGGRASVRFEAVPGASGEVEIPVELTCPAVAEAWSLRHRLHVLPREKALVLFSGFLGCPIRSDDELHVASLPANYALRKPHVFTQLLSQADLVLTSDQHDAVFSAEQIDALTRFVHDGGRMLFYCAWSAPWGRGFFDTFGNVASSRFPDLLPLAMRKGIAHSRRVRLSAAGLPLFGDLAWDTIPAFDHNEADLRAGASLMAESEEGAPLIAQWNVGRGNVLAVAIDCFGFESYVEGLSFDWWPEKPRMIRRGVQWLLDPSRATFDGRLTPS